MFVLLCIKEQGPVINGLYLRVYGDVMTGITPFCEHVVSRLGNGAHCMLISSGDPLCPNAYNHICVFIFADSVTLL